VRYQRFYRIHSMQEALYGALAKQNPILVDDVEVLVKLSAFDATLTPLSAS
jgi:hypothetical protein